MKLCLAATANRKYLRDLLAESTAVLESFVYIKKWQIPYLHKWPFFILDSGVFTFLWNHTLVPEDIQGYADNYIRFIVENDIKYFMNIDLDGMLGYEKTQMLTRYIEKEVGRKSIPVFHNEWKIDGWRKACEEYDFVAIGQSAPVRKGSAKPQILKSLLKIARESNTKVHGLGFTNSRVGDFSFYSVDSSSWVSGSRYGIAYKFDGEKMILKHRPEGLKTIDYKLMDRHNLREWLKYQKYLENR